MTTTMKKSGSVTTIKSNGVEKNGRCTYRAIPLADAWSIDNDNVRLKVCITHHIEDVCLGLGRLALNGVQQYAEHEYDAITARWLRNGLEQWTHGLQYTCASDSKLAARAEDAIELCVNNAKFVLMPVQRLSIDSVCSTYTAYKRYIRVIYNDLDDKSLEARDVRAHVDACPALREYCAYKRPGRAARSEAERIADKIAALQAKLAKLQADK